MSRKRSIRGKGNHGSILRQLCRCYLKGTCTRTPCDFWHPPECQFYKTETGCKVGIILCSRIKRLTNNQTKSQRKSTIPQNGAVVYGDLTTCLVPLSASPSSRIHTATDTGHKFYIKTTVPHDFDCSLCHSAGALLTTAEPVCSLPSLVESCFKRFVPSSSIFSRHAYYG